jgi:predicted nucleic acid-binding Zn ribbon protein
MLFSNKNMSWDKYGECEGDDAIIRQRKLRAVNPLHRGAPCAGSTHQMRMCQQSENPITDIDGAISIENNGHNGIIAGSVHPSKNVENSECMTYEQNPEKNNFLIYFLIFILIITMCGCGVVSVSDEKTPKTALGGSEYVNYTNLKH